MENDANQFVDLGTWVGRSQAFGAIGNQCLAAQAKCLQEVRESQAYKLLGLDFEEFCEQRVGLSCRQVETIIRNLKEFGETYFQLSEIVSISPDAYRKIMPKIQDQQIEISGEMVPIIPENSVRIREAVNRLRAELRKANEDVEVLTSPEIASLQSRLDAWLEDLRRMAPRLASKNEDVPLRGLIDYSIGHLQKIAGGLEAR
ncbi:MAG TPA: hypothetical protein VGH38_06095 [Bryobacteraceae bacterium]